MALQQCGRAGQNHSLLNDPKHGHCAQVLPASYRSESGAIFLRRYAFAVAPRLWHLGSLRLLWDAWKGKSLSIVRTCTPASVHIRICTSCYLPLCSISVPPPIRLSVYLSIHRSIHLYLSIYLLNPKTLK